MPSRRIKADSIRAAAASAISGTYSNLGAALNQVWIQMAIKNATNGTLWVSENGTDDHYEMPAGTTAFYDFSVNGLIVGGYGKAVNTQFQVRGDASNLPTTGRIILEGQYV